MKCKQFLLCLPLCVNNLFTNHQVEPLCVMGHKSTPISEALALERGAEVFLY